MRKFFCIIPLLLYSLTGCVHVISMDLREKVDKNISFKEIIKDPDAVKGKTVLISGVILGSRNTKEGTLIEILQKPADLEERPKEVYISDGRFLALYDGYLDTEIYSRGMETAVAGEITGKRILPLDEIEYSYPLILIKEIHLFKPKKEEMSYRTPYPYWYYQPYYCPYWYLWY